ncbi:hypothetical protein THIOKS13510001 [Thiocapsa sp. KS1]|nr:hypothetical protein THIOKS13510001 [Thiocapsa sp. KS1]
MSGGMATPRSVRRNEDFGLSATAPKPVVEERGTGLKGPAFQQGLPDPFFNHSCKEQ